MDINLQQISILLKKIIKIIRIKIKIKIKIIEIDRDNIDKDNMMTEILKINKEI